MRARTLLAATACATVLAGLTACVPNNPGAGGAGDGAAGGTTALTVSSTEDACTVSEATAPAGTLTFTVTNDGERVTEFYLLADDGLRIIGEVENIAPGASRDLTVVAQPGDYFTVCKPGMVGAGVGQAPFTVTGERVELSADDQALFDEAVTNYTAYVRNQVAELVPATEEFLAAYEAGDDERARELFASTRVFYERIEPTAEAFGDLDPNIDYREVDAVEEGRNWQGFHRIEKDLWPPKPGDENSDGRDALQDWEPSTPEQRANYAKKLRLDVQKLADLVNAEDFSLTIQDITNGARALLDEVATNKITGEEDWWSGTDLYDFQSNVEGAQVAFGIVEDIARAKGEEGAALADEINREFEQLNAALAEHGSLESGFVDYKTLTPEQVKALSNRVDALSEPLSRLTSTIIGE